MGTVTLPNRPTGGDTKNIAQIIADFDAILAQVNGNLESSLNVKTAAAISQDSQSGNAEGSSASLARTDHKHILQGVERLASAPTTGNFLGRLYYNTALNRLFMCTATAGSGTFRSLVSVGAIANGVLYEAAAGGSAQAAPTAAGQVLMSSPTSVPIFRTMPAARVRRTTNQSIVTSTVVAITFDAERDDTDGIHDNVTNNSRLTCQTAGFYMIFGCINFDANATGNRQVAIRLNGANDIDQIVIPAAGGGSATVLSIATGFQLAVGDFVELTVRQTSGVSLAVQVIADLSPEFGMVRCG